MWSCGYTKDSTHALSSPAEATQVVPEQHYMHAEAKNAGDSSAMPKDDSGMQSEGQQEPTRPSFHDSKRFSQVRRRRSSTNGYDAISVQKFASQGRSPAWV